MRAGLQQLSAKCTNFAIQYNLTVASVAILIMNPNGNSPGSGKDPYPEPLWAEHCLLAAVFVGTFLGMLIMGYLGDLLGRSLAMVVTQTMAAGSIFICVVLTAILEDTEPRDEHTVGLIYLVFTITRFTLGFGVGGMYPLSAASAAEAQDGGFEETVSRVGWAFFWQNPGVMAPYVFAMVILPLRISPSYQWRMLLALGMLPCLIVIALALRAWRLEQIDLELEERERSRINFVDGCATCCELREVVATGSSPFLDQSNPANVAMLEEQGTQQQRGSYSIDGGKPQPGTYSTGGNCAMDDSTNNMDLQKGESSKSEDAACTPTPNAITTVTGANLRLSQDARTSFVGVDATARTSSVNETSARTNTSVARGSIQNEMALSPEQRSFYLFQLIGTGGTWFLYDVSFYGTNIFGPIILKKISPSASLETICLQSIFSTLVGCLGLYASIPYIQIFGCKAANRDGFMLMCVCFLMLALSVSSWNRYVSFVIYCCVVFAINFGPNVATYVQPTIIYPRKIRSTYSGISAGSGKVGALLGTLVYPVLKNAWGLSGMMVFQAGLNVVGVFITLIFIRENQAGGATGLRESTFPGRNRTAASGIAGDSREMSNLDSRNALNAYFRGSQTGGVQQSGSPSLLQDQESEVRAAASKQELLFQEGKHSASTPVTMDEAPSILSTTASSSHASFSSLGGSYL